jgi:hypothetical protein
MSKNANAEMMQKILSGSRNLDRMKQDIKEMVGIMCSYFNTLNDHGEHCLDSRNSQCKLHWQATWFGAIFHIQCFDRKNLVYDSAERKLNFEDIKEVHNDLSNFVEALSARVPELALHLMNMMELAPE